MASTLMPRSASAGSTGSSGVSPSAEAAWNAWGEDQSNPVVFALSNLLLAGLIPVVMLTTSSEERDQQASYAHGANGYVVKAFNLEQFGEALAQIKRRWLPQVRLG
mgnify:CR=1 FL=1